MWVTGVTGQYQYEVKVYDNPSYWGINNGRISKLYLYKDRKVVLEYERGWSNRGPHCTAHKNALRAILKKYPGVLPDKPQSPYRGYKSRNHSIVYTHIMGSSMSSWCCHKCGASGKNSEHMGISNICPKLQTRCGDNCICSDVPIHLRKDR